MTTALPRHRWLWLAAGLLMLAEFGLFHRMTALQHAWIHPQWSDQIQYLTESYNSYEVLRTQGWWQGIVYACTNPAAQGTLHDIVAVVVFGVFGPSRLAALDINFAVFLVWQGITLFAVQRVSRSPALGWLGFGLILCVAGPWSADAGSAVDFRLDHAAMCLWGITAATALLTGGFRDLRWSLVFGCLVGLTIIERFLTGAYFAPVFLAAALWIMWGEEKFRRLRNLVLAGAVAFVLAAPFFWLNRDWIYNYYWNGHFANAESAARAPHLGVWGSIDYVLAALAQRQLGPVFLIFSLVITVIPLLLESFWDRVRAGLPKLDRDWLFAAAAFFVLPTVVLCMHRQKSEYVLGILAPGMVLLLLWVWNILLTDLPLFARRPRPGLLATFSVVGLTVGLAFFAVRQVTPAHDAHFIASSRKVRALMEHIYLTAKRNDLRAPQITMDRINDAIGGIMFRVTCYEAHREWVPFGDRLPTGILAGDETEIFTRLAESDFVFLTDEMPGHGHWPSDQQMKKLYPRLKAWCEANLERADTFPLFDSQMSLYQRRGLH